MSQHASPKESGSHHTPASQTIVNENATDATSSQPALRVYLLGPLIIEQANGTLLNLDTLLGRSQSSILFKLLLCQPARRIIRERLADVRRLARRRQIDPQDSTGSGLRTACDAAGEW